MCELMTIGAAAVFTAVWILRRRRGLDASAAFTTMMMFWGAALMWGVDCVANRLEGDPLFDMTREDTVLGFIITAVGVGVHFALSFFTRKRAVKA